MPSPAPNSPGTAARPLPESADHRARRRGRPADASEQGRPAEAGRLRLARWSRARWGGARWRGARARLAGWRPTPTVPLLGLPIVVGLIHVALVAGRYHFGSFDDDASYVLTAKALLAGQGLGGHLASGQAVVGLYPPGYSALIAPLVWVWPHSVLPLRLLSVASFVALFPLTWTYLGRHGVGPRIRSAVLTVMALGPPIATFASMVMAEAPFLVVLLLLLHALDSWEASGELVGRYGAAAVVWASALLWLKQAALGLVAGLVLWLLWTPGRRAWEGRRRRPGRALVLAGGVGLALLPVVVTRLVIGVPLAGARYSEELGGYYSGGLAGRLVHVLPSSAWHLLSTAVPATLVPYLEPLPIAGHWPDLWKVLSWHVTLLATVGAVRWARRERDAALPMVAVYLLESVLWPYVNERRAILVLPLLAAWYVTGAVAAGRWAWRLIGGTAGPARRRWAAGAAAVAVVAVVAAPLVAQTPRDYLYGWGQSSSRPEGSRYVAILSRLGRPADVVETDYQSTIALLTGHATNWSAFLSTAAGVCWLPALQGDLAADRAGFLVLGDVNKPGLVDSPCLAKLMATYPGAVALLHTARDSAVVYELVGPGTGHPQLADLLGRAAPVAAHDGSVTVEEWSLPRPEPVAQVSVGEAAAQTGPTTSVRLELQQPDGRWITVAAAQGPVGDGPGRAPFLLATPHSGTATAVRVVVAGRDPAAGASVSDVAVVGPSVG